MAINDTLTDKRVVARNILKGLVDQKELDKHVKGLPDVGDNVEIMSYGEDDEDGEDGEE